MKKYILLLFVLFIFSCDKKTTSSQEELTFDEKLFALEGVVVTEIAPQNGFPRQFEIYISQPLDHENPNGTQFEQRIFLSHRDEEAPVVFMPSGYTNRPTTNAEISDILNANQIYVAHRYMFGAEPSNMEWEYLTVEQAAADFHAIVEMFKKIYKGKWVSYGASKNGDTVLFHKKFFPDDVNVALTKVAPISFSQEDSRYDEFLVNVGTQEKRDKIKRVQIELLENRNGIIPQIQEYINNSSLTYTLTAGAILEYETLEYPFAYWQYYVEDNSTIPDTGLTANEYYNFVEDGGYLPFYSDQYLDFYEPFYYQMYTELGYYRLIDDHLAHLLVDLPDPSYSDLAPEGVIMNYSPALMIDINNWLENEGDNIIYIYGEIDPWTAGAVTPGASTNAIKIIQPNANHSISLYDLDQRDLVFNTLEDWLEITINLNRVDANRPNFLEDELLPFSIESLPL